MVAADFVEVVVTCKSWQHAQTVADTLLQKRLVASAEFIDGMHGEEGKVKLIMETIADKCEAIKTEIKKLPGYSASAVQVVPMTHISSGTASWLEDEIK